MSVEPKKLESNAKVEEENSFVTSAPAINLPKGGGAIRGMGEKFAANPVTGTGSLTVPIATSPGRAGFGPQLALTYDSGAGNGPFGLGWHLSLPAITRKTDKGLPKYQDADDSDVFILSGAEDLVPVFRKDAGGKLVLHEDDRPLGTVTYRIRRYRPRIEGLFARIERWTNNANPTDVFWRSITKDNVTTFYGRPHENPDSSIDPNHSRIADPADPTRIFTWLICQSHDCKGNAMRYEYLADDSRGVDTSQVHERNRTDESRSSNRYLKRIRYGNETSFLTDGRTVSPLGPDLSAMKWFFEVVFDYGEHDLDDPKPSESGVWSVRNDPFSSYRSGFEVRTYRLCQRVLMFHHFPDTRNAVGNKVEGYDGLVRSTDFNYRYEENPTDPRNSIFSFLKSATQIGYKRQLAGGYLKRSLPPVEFIYSEATIQQEIREVDLASLENLPSGLDGSVYQWVDLDGEGLSGILTEQATGWFYKRNLSPINTVGDNGSSHIEARFAPVELVAAKSSFGLAADHAQFMDLAGDGQPDLVLMDGPVRGFYERTFDADWEPFRAFSLWPNVDTSDPNLKFIDLDGDGHADILISEDDAFTWYPSLAEDGFGPALRTHQSWDEEKGPRLVFADGEQSIYLADFSGDGLTDLVRIRNGEVCYWPNLGYGQFGAKVTMDDSPQFDSPDQFDQKRIRLADIDGSGTTDILYLHREGVRIYFNQSGNRWSPAVPLPQFPAIDNVSSIQALDLLGNGTACLVWSSPLPGDARHPMRYIDLMGEKPDLLTRTINNLGAETVVSYAPSTKFYLQDDQAGKPWITRLPFPVHVVERVEVLDRLSRNRFVTRYTYHHGFFDGVEREFRGFGMVEQFDTEEIGVLEKEGATAANEASASYVPPMYTRTWFHTGAWRPADELTAAFKKEYWSGDPAGFDIADTIFPMQALSVDEEREACRALRGSVLRQEIYADDASEGATDEDKARARRPYRVSERNYTVAILQPQGANRHGVFFVHPRETLDAHHERLEKPDPRVTHQMVLKVDDFGNVEQAVAIGYGRISPSSFAITDPNPFAENSWTNAQQRTLLTFSRTTYTNGIDDPDAWRTPLPGEVFTYELTGHDWSDTPTILPFDGMRADLKNEGDDLVNVNYEDQPDRAATAKKARRLVERVRTLYRKDDLTGLLPLKKLPADISLESLALAGESYKLALSPGLLGLLKDKATVPTLTSILSAASAGYRDLDGDGNLWIPSGLVFFSPGATDSSAVELPVARLRFFLPHRFKDIFGKSAFVIYDTLLLFPVKVTDAAGNSTSAIYDYRVLQPHLLKDANENFIEAVFDALGLVGGTAILGKSESGALGDTLAGFVPNLTAAEIDSFFNDLNPRVSAPTLLGKATSRIIYDVNAFQRSFAANPDKPEKWQPVCAATLARERHVNDPPADGKVRVQVSFSYSDGFGREMQKKIQAEDGPLVEGGPDVSPRWVGRGWTIFNNKGNPVRQYEPFFSTLTDRRHQFEFDRQEGVSATLFYDPVGRVVATLHPNHTWEKVVFDPWQQTAWDVNDTVKRKPAEDADVGDYFARLPAADFIPTWHERRSGGALGSEEQQAAEKAAVHADTPTVTCFDTLGRSFLVVTHNHWLDSTATEHTERAATQTILDIEGQQLAVKDAKFRTVMAWDYDYLGRPLCQHGMDGGARWTLTDAANQPLRRWDERKHEFSYEYDDPLHRPTKYLLSTNGAPAICYERFTYGDTTPGAAADNLRGRLVEYRDTAGLVTNGPFDEKGNLLSSKRQVCGNFRTTPDWNGVPTLDADSFTTSTAYDALGRPKMVTAPDGSVTTPEYNEANFLNAVTPVTPAIAATATTPALTKNTHSVITNIDYDAKGRRTRVDYGNGLHTEFTYDPETFRLIRLFSFKGNNRAAPLQDLNYAYDPAGNITSLRDKSQPRFFFNNRVVDPRASYTYDALYRLIEATGREHIGQNLPSNAWDSHRRGTFDGGCQFAPFPLPGDSKAMRNYTQLYEYDSVGNFKQLRHVANGASWTRTYKYDEPSLIKSDPPGTKNNRLTSTSVGPNTETYTHDDHGSIIQMPHLVVMETDVRDQLSKTQRQVITCAPDKPASNGEITWYVYDSGGERVRKVTTRGRNRVSERLYLGAWETYREYDATDTKDLERHALHVRDGQKCAALIETRSFGTDASAQQLARLQFTNDLGTATLEVELALGARLISYEEYHPYGTTAFQAMNAEIKAIAKRYRYTGKERDEETGLNYHGARYYSPWIGRWTSCDPIELRGGGNLFLAVNGNPLKFLDPKGTENQVPEFDPSKSEILGVAPMQQQTFPITQFRAQGEAAQNKLVEMFEAKGHDVRTEITIKGGPGGSRIDISTDKATKTIESKLMDLSRYKNSLGALDLAKIETALRTDVQQVLKHESHLKLGTKPDLPMREALVYQVENASLEEAKEFESAFRRVATPTGVKGGVIKPPTPPSVNLGGTKSAIAGRSFGPEAGFVSLDLAQDLGKVLLKTGEAAVAIAPLAIEPTPDATHETLLKGAVGLGLLRFAVSFPLVPIVTGGVGATAATGYAGIKWVDAMNRALSEGVQRATVDPARQMPEPKKNLFDFVFR